MLPTLEAVLYRVDSLLGSQQSQRSHSPGVDAMRVNDPAWCMLSGVRVNVGMRVVIGRFTST